MKYTKGITIIALVITIIVLLILAGVIITLVIGDNGIINKSKNVTDIYEQQNKNEIKYFSEIDNEINKVLNIKKQKSEIVEVQLKTSLNHSESFDGIIITLENKLDTSKTQKYEMKSGESDHTFYVDENEKYSINVTDKQDEFYTFETPEETIEYTAESGKTRKIQMVYVEKEAYLYRNEKENAEMIGTFNYKKVNHSSSYSGTGSYTPNMTVSINGLAAALMVSDKKVNVKGYSKLYVEANITKNVNEFHRTMGLLQNKDFQYFSSSGLSIFTTSATGATNMELNVGENEEVYVIVGIGTSWQSTQATMKITQIKLIS